MLGIASVGALLVAADTAAIGLNCTIGGRVASATCVTIALIKFTFACEHAVHISYDFPIDVILISCGIALIFYGVPSISCGFPLTAVWISFYFRWIPFDIQWIYLELLCMSCDLLLISFGFL